MKLRVLAILTAVACLGYVQPIRALDIPAVLDDFRITSWAGGDGITLGAVRKIVQDRDGYLWLASDAGLVRFDGFRFATTDIAGATRLPAAPSRAVYLARDGSLWAGYGGRYGIYHLGQGEVQHIHLQNQIAGFVNAITEDRSGAMWVGHDEGLYRFRDGAWDPIPMPMPSTGSDSRVFAVHEDRTGTIWVGTAYGLYRRTTSGAFEKTGSHGMVRAISEDAAGHVWVTDETAGLRRAGGVDSTHPFEGRGMSLFRDRRGNFWVATIGQGLWQVRVGDSGGAPLGVRRATTQNGLLSDETSGFLEDREGNIWAGSNQGLHRLTPHKLTSLVDIGVVRALTFSGDGTAWAGTTTGLIPLRGVTSPSTNTRGTTPSVAIRTLHTAGDGTVWAATDTGLQRLVNGRLVPVSHDGPRLNHVTSISSDRRGALWVCDDTQGLVRLVNRRLERFVNVTAATRPTLAHVDGTDRVWIAFDGGEVGVIDDAERMQRYGPAEGVAHTTVYSIHHDRRGDIWVGGDGGLSLLRGNRFQTLTDRQGLPQRPVTAVIDDDAGDVWVAISYFGFIRLGREEISRAMTVASHRLTYPIYTASDGIAGAVDPLNSSAAAKGPDGRLWFVTNRGLTVLDPQRLRDQGGTAPGRPRIESVTADDRRYDAVTGAVLPPKPGRLRVDYTLVSLSSPTRIRFRYRLDGFDTDWVDGTGPRQASYTNLPPGRYRFRLQATDGTTTWENAETDWAFSIQPMYYQTGWFYAVCALGFGLVAMGAWQLRVRHVRKELAVVFGERIRLSREIHDTLLQSLVGIALQLDSASHSLKGRPSHTAAQLVDMRKQIEDYIREVRQSIWDLRSPALDKHGLIGALRDTGHRLTAGKVRFALTVTGTPRPCPSKVEMHVLRIGHEAVMNAVRHAQARHVQMDIGFDHRLLRLRVADDGRGFDGEQQPSGSNGDVHYGLLSMKERAEDAGGRCTIESTPGLGVQVVAEFPLAPPAA